MNDLLLLCIAGFAAGALNAVAGGGTFLTFPALVYLGIPPVAANATATLTALPGYVGSAWAFRHDFRDGGNLSLRNLFAVGMTGSLIGAVLLMMTSDQAFSGIVPWLLLVATALFALGPKLIHRMREKGGASATPFVTALVVIAVSIYGGYFNGGLGIMLLAALGLLGYTDLHTMNGLKNFLSAILSLTSAIAFAFSGLIDWESGLPMAVATLIGGSIAAHSSRKVNNTNYIRVFVIVVGTIMTVLFFLQGEA